MRSFRVFSSTSLALILILSAISYPGYISENNFFSAQAETFGVVMDDNKDYITFNSEFPNKIEALTISAWVTPDFDDGSSVFTVVGKNEAFAVYLNRSVEPDNRATFAVYDGMMWHNVMSKSKINNGEMVHIVATFGDASISIYINGELEATVSDIDIRKIIKGKMLQGPLSFLYSEYEISVGAFTNIKKSQVKVSKEFAGIIYSVDLYEKTLDKSEVKELFLTSFDIKEFSEGHDVVQEATTDTKNTQRTIESSDSDAEDTKNYQVKRDTSEPQNTNKVFDNSDSGDGGKSYRPPQESTGEQNQDETEVGDFGEGNTLVSSSETGDFDEGVTLVSSSKTGSDFASLSILSLEKIKKDIESWGEKANSKEKEANDKNARAVREDSRGNHEEADKLRNQAEQLQTEANLLSALVNYAEKLLGNSDSENDSQDESTAVNISNGVQFGQDVILISSSATKTALSPPNLPADVVEDYKELIEKWLKQVERKQAQADDNNDKALEEKEKGNDERSEKLLQSAQQLLDEANYLREMADYLQGLLDGKVILFVEDPPVVLHITLEQFISNLERVSLKYTELYGDSA